MDGDRKMKREVQFVNSMTEKLKTQGDISKEEATRMFVLASVIYAYGMGWCREGRFWDSFSRFDFFELSDAIGKWYEELLTRIPDEISDKYLNCITSIPSVAVCPAPEHAVNTGSTAPRIMDAICEIRREKTHALMKNPVTSDSVRANGPMVEWLKSNVPLSFDVTYCYKYTYDFEVQFARFGVLSLLPIHVREIDEDGLGRLSDLDIPILRTESIVRKGLFRKFFYRVACLPEHENILDAVADYLPAPERRPVEKRPYTPRDLLYVDTLTSHVSCGRDISIEEADDLYLLFKMYQAIRTAALKTKGSVRQEMKDSAEPGLNALRSWYKAVEKELKKNRKGNFVYTLPNDTNMNLYQLRDPVERCLNMLPKEPSKIMIRYDDRFPVKDDCLDAKSSTSTGISDRYVYYLSGRYGFFDRNGIDVSEWHPVAEYEDGVSYNVFNDFRGKPILGKLRFAESLGIKHIVVNDITIAVRENDLDRMREILELSDDEIMRTAYLLAKKDLKEIRSEIDRLKKKPENQEALDILLRKERMLRTLEDEIPLEYIIEGVKVVYRERKERKEYLEEDGWMEIER